MLSHHGIMALLNPHMRRTSVRVWDGMKVRSGACAGSLLCSAASLLWSTVSPKGDLKLCAATSAEGDSRMGAILPLSLRSHTAWLCMRMLHHSFAWPEHWWASRLQYWWALGLQDHLSCALECAWAAAQPGTHSCMTMVRQFHAAHLTLRAGSGSSSSDAAGCRCGCLLLPAARTKPASECQALMALHWQ